MGKDTIVIREIEVQDDAQIEQVIRNCFYEFEIPLEGTAYTDPETSQMFKGYQGESNIYYVIEYDGEVCGGCGLKPLPGYENEICEIQKMYFTPKIRGKGLGRTLIQNCIKKAREFGYKKCYIESAPQLKAAIRIYEDNGFQHLESALGNTGHHACGIWMIKEL
ncbi:GNAT family N-acetyltransferase [Tamlana haliotis]|uniref:GNAT family N-acetyltransferase n=1 Tax=Pseudotamlana haliotis TaxID=2614804 RepID=A0A6N6MAK6_9FLAO|nr:GNAT family N-acetyltransferase [Tamlana haliotis]KAB1067263.1 GNAT family N-acetyltransferase [Tamlana haliotis]